MNPETPKAAPEAPGNGAPPTDELTALRQRAEAAEQARDQYLKLARQTQADFENYQQRVRRDQATERRFVHGPFVLELLPALDNLDRALQAAKQAGDNGVLAQGVEMVRTQLLDALRRHGITRVEPLGQPLDPNQHEAVSQVPAAGHAPRTVVQVLEPGYQLHERLLRPARVVVAGAPA